MSLAGDHMALPGTLAARLGDRFADDRAMILNAGASYGWTSPAGHRRIVVHHTAGPREQKILDIDAFHRIGRGWPGIGYHFVVRMGVLHYVGDLATERAHIWGRNADSIGIAVTGSYNDVVVVADDDVAVLRLAVATLDELYLPPLDLVGHGLASLPNHGTACPGKNLLSVIRSLRDPESGKVPRLDMIAAATAPIAFDVDPTAALVKAMRSQGFAPAGREVRFVDNGTSYVCQAAANPVTGAAATFYCAVGDWAHVRAVRH